LSSFGFPITSFTFENGDIKKLSDGVDNFVKGRRNSGSFRTCILISYLSEDAYIFSICRIEI